MLLKKYIRTLSYRKLLQNNCYIYYKWDKAIYARDFTACCRKLDAKDSCSILANCTHFSNFKNWGLWFISFKNCEKNRSCWTSFQQFHEIYDIIERFISPSCAKGHAPHALNNFQFITSISRQLWQQTFFEERLHNREELQTPSLMEE